MRISAMFYIFIIADSTGCLVSGFWLNFVKPKFGKYANLKSVIKNL
jgi:hypothetical protein